MTGQVEKRMRTGGSLDVIGGLQPTSEASRSGGEPHTASLIISASAETASFQRYRRIRR